ncbi:MmgE/PrpD family protein [Consotaella salsifontis]|uniref:2-methylcitrate dehydratase PrpD n=1 Tax=Consotaella salsifontis TaxID=1365950 RepID=A0A1T4RMB4_9HYPH|nr:MmgE/PrpD family protein [Consotaella salsifontis]SKA16878.1 2-methylcitrate dehydratase PrpD [Consotaella salsifontis]
MTASPQQELASFIAGCDLQLIPNRLIADMKYRVIDWLGCASVGRNYEQCAIARRLFSEMGGASEATMIGARGLYPVASAAMVNGIVGHVSELDDGHRKAIGHPGSVTLPVALALGEKRSVTGADFLKALIIGYDVFIRLGQAVNPSHYAYWHTTSTCGSFAAAATAASLMKLSPTQTCNALGIAGTLTGGLVASFGFHAKALNVGHACQNGIQAAMLAEAGFTGSPRAIAGEKGFLSATSREGTGIEVPTEATLLSDTAFYKVYASCGHTNSPLDVMFALLRDHPLKPSAIKSIRAETYSVSVALTGALKTESEDAAKFSLPYCLAVAIMFGRVSLAEFAPEMRSDEAILALARKVSVIESGEATARFPRRQAKVSVELTDGTILSRETMDSTDIADPIVLDKKFFDQAKDVDSNGSRSAFAFVQNIDTSPSITPLLDFLKSL